MQLIHLLLSVRFHYTHAFNKHFVPERLNFTGYLCTLVCFLNSQISDIRERLYEKMGIGSSYLFRLDDGYVVSKATFMQRGNLIFLF